MATDFDRDDRLDGLLRDTLRSQAATGSCIDAATLAAWADNALTPEETAAVDTHVATCARCRDLAAALSTMTEAEETPAAVVVPFAPRPNGRWKVIVGAMGAVAASALIWVAVRDGTPALDTTSAGNRAEQSQARGMGGNVPATAPERSAADASVPAQRAERLLGQQGQRIGNTPLPEAKLARENARTAEPRQSSAKPSTAPVRTDPPAQAIAPPPPAVAAAPPPPPPPAPPPVATGGGARASIVTGLPQSEAFFAVGVIAEFVVGADLQAPEGQVLGAVADRSRAGGAGGGGRGGGAVARQTTAGFSTEPVRWRLRAASPAPSPSIATVERSRDGGATWQAVPLPALSVPLLSGGSAPANTVCWLVGTAGTVLLSTDGTTFRQVTKPVDADLISVRATDARSATVRTADGRSFTTTDGGVTWTRRE